ncbi:MAG: tRNA dihydrouridine synthase DusB [Planctomycetes bacterium]|jgi:nifR3 family TIM-barrel protein|nr:tRNA dihydrouridine synthase DusB [Planctomycetota bacterium]
MAGVTNWPFRAICRRYGAGLFVSEMITARGFVEENAKTHRLTEFGPGETPRSLQLYGTEPGSLAEATRRLVGEGRVDHLDLNFGCPVRKVTVKGGGAAIPLKPRLLARLVRAVVGCAGAVPVTMKFRLGIDEDHFTYRDAGRVGEEEGCAGVALHARTAEQLYGGEARWEFIADLKSQLRIPVLGNGDIREGRDGLRMMRETGCDGVVIGRGCLGRPWLFRDLADVFEGREPAEPPCFGEVYDTLLDHARLLVRWLGEPHGVREMRKHAAWYTKAFPGGAALRAKLMTASAFADLERLAGSIDRGTPFPPAGLRLRRAKGSAPQKVHLPFGYLDRLDDDTPPGPEAENPADGG